MVEAVPEEGTKSTGRRTAGGRLQEEVQAMVSIGRFTTQTLPVRCFAVCAPAELFLNSKFWPETLCPIFSGRELISGKLWDV